MSTTVVTNPLGSVPFRVSNASLTASDPKDVYQFTIAGTKPVNFNASVHGRLPADTPNLRLFQDSNHNGQFDLNTDQLVNSDFKGADRTINQQISVTAGTYFAVVQPPSSSTTTQSQFYSIDLSATPRPVGGQLNPSSNLLGVEQAFGEFGSFRKDDVAGTITNKNTADIYSFHYTEGNNRSMTIKLDGLKADADLLLIRDDNRNRIADAGEVVGRSSLIGNSAESITINRSGNYLIQVQQFTGETNYLLNLESKVVPS